MFRNRANQLNESEMEEKHVSIPEQKQLKVFGSLDQGLDEGVQYFTAPAQ